jgi:hypothetical protein
MNEAAHNKSYLQWLGDVYIKSFIFAITFGHGGQIRFQKPATANSQTLCATFYEKDSDLYFFDDCNKFFWTRLSVSSTKNGKHFS